MSETWIVVPCYNEAARLRADVFAEFARAHRGIRFLLVDDGSTDDTLSVLRRLGEADPEAFQVLAQRPNKGKAEAVRLGMNHAFERGAIYAGYWDADLATSLDEIPGFVETLDANPRLEILLGARVKLLGRNISRKASRHYLGRVLATAISLSLGLAVYDTQCGAKLFRHTPACAAPFAQPFATDWIFDVEILARVIQARRGSGLTPAGEVIREIPLREWHDVPGSKVRPWDFFRGFAQLARIRRLYG